MGSSVAMPLLLIGALFMATLVVGVESAATDDDDQPIINDTSPPPQSYNGGQVQGAQECLAAFVNGGECFAVVYRVFRGDAEQTAPVCCKMMMEISQKCRLLMFPNPNIFPIFTTYCAFRSGGGSDTAPGAGAGAGAAGPPAPSPVGL